MSLPLMVLLLVFVAAVLIAFVATLPGDEPDYFDPDDQVT